MERQDILLVVHQVEVEVLVMVYQQWLTKVVGRTCGLIQDLDHVSRLSVPRSEMFQLRKDLDL